MKNNERWHRRLFCHCFCGAAKNWALTFLELVERRDARAGERHQLVGHQVDEQVRHRAVQALEGEPSEVARAGADTASREAYDSMMKLEVYFVGFLHPHQRPYEDAPRRRSC